MLKPFAKSSGVSRGDQSVAIDGKGFSGYGDLITKVEGRTVTARFWTRRLVVGTPTPTTRRRSRRLKKALEDRIIKPSGVGRIVLFAVPVQAMRACTISRTWSRLAEPAFVDAA